MKLRNMAESNGRCEIKVGEGAEERTFPLLFGLAAVREMARRTVEGFTANEIKVLTDLVYAGRMNAAIADDLPFPSYGECYALIEEFQSRADATEQFDRVWEVFNTSKFGAEWLKTVDEAKKKAIELMEAGLQTGIGKS